MSIVFAVVGGAVYMGITYSDHNDYSNYDNYSNYSDAAVRRERRLQAKREEKKRARQEVNAFKADSVNAYLKSDALINEPGESVNVPAVERDANEKITDEERQESTSETADLQKEINEIDNVIFKIDKILEEKS